MVTWQVIGELEGAPGWHEVMDMASGKVYFWESSTNGVAWEPPQGSRPRSTSLQHEQELQAQRDAADASAATLSAHTASADLPAGPTHATTSAAVTEMDGGIKRLGRGLIAELAEALLARMGPHAIPDLLRLAVQAEICLQDYKAVAALFKQQQQPSEQVDPLCQKASRKAILRLLISMQSCWVQHLPCGPSLFERKRVMRNTNLCLASGHCRCMSPDDSRVAWQAP